MMNTHKVAGSKVIDGDNFVTRRITLEVINTVSDSRREIIVRPIFFR